MNFIDIFLIGIALSMDAFAVSICKGLSVKKVSAKHVLTVGVYFGGFQALMPTLGFLLGYRFESFITSIDHWIAFILLALIGGNMIREALGKDEEHKNDDFSFKAMLPLAVATSIDALAVGVSFAFSPPGPGVVLSCAVIGCTTFLIAFGGAMAASRIPGIRPKTAEIAGGIILVGIGVKLLLEGLLK